MTVKQREKVKENTITKEKDKENTKTLKYKELGTMLLFRIFSAKKFVSVLQ
jgi:hypothetical protein